MPSRLSEILQDVDEVDDDRHGHLAGLCTGMDPLDLVVVAVHERDPAALVVGVARVGSSKMAPTTVAASTALAVNHLLRALGPAVASRRWVSSVGRMSAVLRGTGVAL